MIVLTETATGARLFFPKPEDYFFRTSLLNEGSSEVRNSTNLEENCILVRESLLEIMQMFSNPLRNSERVSGEVLTIPANAGSISE